MRLMSRPPAAAGLLGDVVQVSSSEGDQPGTLVNWL